MAKQLNEMLTNQCITGHGVKNKINNLISEYRKKKTEQEKTGKNPRPWPYYDSINKLLADSMIIDPEQVEDSSSDDSEESSDDDIENYFLQLVEITVAQRKRTSQFNSRVLELLKKQNNLQEQRLKNKKELLDILKTIVNNMNTN